MHNAMAVENQAYRAAMLLANWAITVILPPFLALLTLAHSS